MESEELIKILSDSYVKSTYWDVKISNEDYKSLIDGKRDISCSYEHTREILGESSFKDFKIIFLLTCCIDTDYDEEEDSLDYDIQHRLNNILIVGNEELNRNKKEVLEILDREMEDYNSEVSNIFDLENGANDVIYNMGDESFHNFE